MPDVNGEVVLEDARTHSQVIINPEVAKKAYEKYAYMQGEMVREIIEKSETDHLDLITDKSFAEPLAVFLKERIQGR